MRKIVASLHITLDGFAAGPNGEMDWIRIDSKMFDFVKSLTDKADSALYGRLTWQMMDNYWPNAGTKVDASKHDKEHSAWYNKVEKIVLSNSLQGQEAEKTIFIGKGVINAIDKIKRKSGKDILIFGSPSVVRLLMKKNLIDEYYLFVNPVILGHGLSIFPKRQHHINLELKSSMLFECGVSALVYTAAKN